MNTVTNDSWSVGSMSPSRNGSGAELHVSRPIGGKTLRAEADGRVFPNSDAAHAWALEHGFLRRYYSSNKGFIVLRLAPATRRFLRTKSGKDLWTFLFKALNELNSPGSYAYTVRVKDFAQPTRERWLRAIYERGGERHPSRVKTVVQGKGRRKGQKVKPAAQLSP